MYLIIPKIISITPDVLTNDSDLISYIKSHIIKSNTIDNIDLNKNKSVFTIQDNINIKIIGTINTEQHIKSNLIFYHIYNKICLFTIDNIELINNQKDKLNIYTIIDNNQITLSKLLTTIKQYNVYEYTIYLTI